MGSFIYSKTSDPEPGSTVEIGEVITYTVTVEHSGSAPITASITDDLSAVLDDATYVAGSLTSSAGTPSINLMTSTLTWSGDLIVGQIVDITYSVTVTGDGDMRLRNVVTTTDTRGVCVPDSLDGNPDCTTTHQVGDYTVVKTADPADTSAVGPGDTVTYTVTVTHVGVAEVEASFEDDLSAVLDDATFDVNSIEASADRFVQRAHAVMGRHAQRRRCRHREVFGEGARRRRPGGRRRRDVDQRRHVAWLPVGRGLHDAASGRLVRVFEDVGSGDRVDGSGG